MPAGSRGKQSTSSREVRAPAQQASTVPDAFTLNFVRSPAGFRVCVGLGQWVEGESLAEAFVNATAALAALKPAVATPPQDTRRECTCTGSCRGAVGLAPGSKCALERRPSSGPVDELRNAGVL